MLTEHVEATYFLWKYFHSTPRTVLSGQHQAYVNMTAPESATDKPLTRLAMGLVCL